MQKFDEKDLILCLSAGKLKTCAMAMTVKMDAFSLKMDSTKSSSVIFYFLQIETRMAKTSLFCLEKIFSGFSICKQKDGKIAVGRLESIEIKGIGKNVWKNEQFFAENNEKFNKSNFLFHTYCIFVKVGYND